jgi:membrane protease YdiL (CAAX protease family)
MSKTSNHTLVANNNERSNQFDDDSSEELELHENANRLLASLQVVGYMLLFGVFVVLMMIIDNVSIPLALPFVWVLLIYEVKYGERPFSGLGFKRVEITKEIIIGIMVGIVFALVGLYSPMGGILTRQGEDDLSNSFVFGVGFTFPLNLLLEVVYIFAFLAPSEEILFRGFIQGKLQDRTSKAKAIVVQSTIFGLLHVLVILPFLPLIWSLVYGASASVAAITFGLIFAYRDGNIIACWIAHTVVNSTFALVNRIC